MTSHSGSEESNGRRVAMNSNKKGTETSPAPNTITNHSIVDRLSLLFFIIFLAVIIIEQFYDNDRLVGFGLGMGLASLFTHCVAMKLDDDIRRFDKKI